MQSTMSQSTLINVLEGMIQQANRMSVTTIGGNYFDAYEPIILGHDYIVFNTSVHGNETVAIRWEAIAAITAGR